MAVGVQRKTVTIATPDLLKYITQYMYTLLCNNYIYINLIERVI